MRAPLRVWSWTAIFVSLFMSSNGAPGSNTWTTHVNNLNAAMEGYDPVMSNHFERPDPGIRNQIFEPITRLNDGSVVLNSFVDKAREFLYCDSELTAKTIRNYNNYKAERSSTHKFSHGADISATANFGWFSFEASAGYGRNENSEESSIKKFFQETNGEIIEHKVQCITHAVSIALFEKPVFTHAFLTGLRRLHVAAQNPLLKESKDTFKEFVSSYGTHYMRTTFLGSKIIFQKLFTSKLVDRSSQSERRKCVETSAYVSIGPSFVAFASASASFSIASSKCDNSDTSNAYFQDNSMNSEKIISMGSLPITNFEQWDATVKDSPVPIYYDLRKISSLFSSEWFNSIPLNDDNHSEMINGTAMYDFFEECSSRYCELMLGSECPAEEKGCGINSDCDDGIRQCVEDPDSHLGYRCDIKYGGVIIAGGWDGERDLSDVESFDTWKLPSLPNAISDPTLSVVGSKLYNCGGLYCYVLDRHVSFPSWSRYTSPPETLVRHSAAVVGSDIWYVYNNQLFGLSTVSHAFKTYNLPFHCDKDHSAVSNATHSYVIGAGSDRNEIWVNNIATIPEKWHKVAIMSEGRQYHACLWLNENVYITGGGTSRRDVEVFNTITGEIWKTGSMDFGRHDHHMMVLDGKPAVVAGYGGTSAGHLDNIEIYDLETRTWRTSFRKLKKKKGSFALAQLHD